MKPMLSRTCRFCRARHVANLQRILSIPLFGSSVTFKHVALTACFGYFFILIQFLHDRQGSLPSLYFMLLQLIQPMLMFAMSFQCFHVSTDERHFSMFEDFTTRHGSHDALQSAHVPNLSLCVAFGAP